MAIINGTNGADTLSGTALSDTMNGYAGDDFLYGGAGNDSLSGNEGNDTLQGGSGLDTQFGGDGDDLLLLDNPGDLLDGGAGNDQLYIQADLGAALTTLRGGAGDDTLYGGNIILDGFSIANGIETWITNGREIDGTRSNNLFDFSDINVIGTMKIYADAGSDTIIGTSSDDKFDGGVGEDVLVGGSGNDTIYAQLDNYYYGDPLALPDEPSSIGDFVRGGDGDDRLVIQDFTGQELDGGLGNDTIDFGILSGAWELTYQSPLYIDLYTQVALAVRYVYNYEEDIGLRQSLALYFSSIENVVGSEYRDDIFGDDGANLLDGNRGNDYLDGGDGDDTLIGGDYSGVVAGRDFLVGGAGFDVVDYRSASSGGTIRLDGAQGATIGGVADALFDIEGAFGSLGADTIAGSTAANRLDGAEGNDLISGGDGDDTISGGAGADTLHGGGGIDTVDYSAETNGMRIDLALERATQGALVETITGFENAIGTRGDDTLLGTATGNRLEGGNGADSLSGGDGADTLVGGLGNDTLDGQGGSDVLQGGLGDDVYRRDNSVDTITEFAGEGTDRVESAVSFSLAGIANVENLTLTGGAFSATGNSLANLITGNGATNSLSGGDGNDTLVGGNGTDTLVGGAGNDLYRLWDADTITEVAGGGTDTVEVFFSYSLAALTNVENLILTSGAVNGTGNALANAITGNAAANSLAGGDGTDTLAGGDGNDTLAGDAGADTLEGGAGNDSMVGGANGDRFVWTDTSFAASGDVAGGVTDRVLAVVGDVDRLDFTAAIEAQLEVNNVNLGTTGGYVVLGSTFSAGNTNVIFDPVADRLQIDLDGNGVFDAASDFQVVLAGINTVTYSGSTDTFFLA